MTTEEEAVMGAADALGQAERDVAQEFLRLVAIGTNSFQAQKMAEVAVGHAVYRRRADYEIAVARLRR